MTGEELSDEITIRVKLPQPVGKVSKLLSTLGELWPGTVVCQDPDWTVDVPADE